MERAARSAVPKWFHRSRSPKAPVGKRASGPALTLTFLTTVPMPDPGTILCRALITGSIASAVSAAFLGLLAKAEGKVPVQPINATSHWLHGEEAGAVTSVDVQHTATGYATHHAATVFWAALFETLQSAAPDAGPGKVIRNAALVSTIAAIVDYGLAPKRLTPGWEGPLPIRSVAGGFAGMACGLAIGSLVRRPLTAS